MADTTTRLAAGAERMEKIADKSRSRQIARVTRSNIPVPPSTLYQRVDRPFGVRPQQQGLCWPSAGQPSPTPHKAAPPAAWRHRLPWVLRWVMGWP